MIPLESKLNEIREKYSPKKCTCGQKGIHSGTHWSRCEITAGDPTVLALCDMVMEARKDASFWHPSPYDKSLDADLDSRLLKMLPQSEGVKG